MFHLGIDSCCCCCWQIFFTCFASALLAYIIFGCFKRRNLNKAVLERRQRFADSKAALRKRLATTDTVQLEKRRLIVQLKFSDLAEKLQKGELSAVDVLHAYQWRALTICDDTNCNCVVEFVDEAEEFAKQLDHLYNKDSNIAKPPLFGIPISVKESIQIKGHDSTRGYVRSLNQQASESANLIRLLQDAGAVPFVRTNVPQTLLSFACSNPIYGRTSHPTHSNRTCGGSSGGEAALIRLFGSVLGVGSDVGGSIRVPAHYSGVVGFKPTSDRMTQLRSVASIPGRPMMCATAGPMGRDVHSLVMFMKVLLDKPMFDSDPYVMPVPFRDEIFRSTEPLTIGYYETDGFFDALPCCRRVVSKTKQLLEQAGHRLVPFQPPDIPLAVSLIVRSCVVDGGQYIIDQLADDLVDPCVRLIHILYCTPVRLRHWLGKLVRPLDAKSALLLGSFASSTADLRRAYEAIGHYRTLFVERWKRASLDALICPPHAVVAMPDHVMARLMSVVSYSALYNLLDFPAGSVQCSVVSDRDEQSVEDEYNVRDLSAKQVFQNCRVGSGSVGLPVGLQCVTLHGQDELCLRLMAEVERLWS
ncbi:Fatty acid amide hydrolase 1 [Trichinella sp. T9]|nr:Fatty acid amide hydrolase 1 [Trichinella sp. T9]